MTDTISENSLSLGQQLKQAREALGLSIEDVAQKTNLKRPHIESIENDIFILKNVPPAFVRGYVRNYVRFLRLPETLVSSVNYGEVTIPKEIRRSAPLQVNPKSQTRWVKYLTYVVLLGAIGMTLLWWWQDYQQEQQSRERIVSHNVTEQVEPEKSAIPLTLPNNSTTTVEVTAQPENTSANENTATLPTAEQPVLSVPETVTAETANIAMDSPMPVAESATPALPEATLPAISSDAENTAATAEQENAIISDELRIEITGAESWVTVRDAKNKRLAEKLYKSGEVLNFNDHEQYRLTIGAPANVKIYYKGQPVPLKVDGRVARFKLPLAN